MNKRIVYISLAVLALIVGGGGYLLANGDGKQAKDQMVDKAAPLTQTIPTQNDTQNKPVVTQTPESSPGKYVDYTDTVVATTTGTKLLFFHAPWCPQCRELEADIKANTIPTGTTIIKVDYDSNQSLRKKYGITLQTTIARVNDQGELVKKFVAYDSPSLGSIIKNLL